MLDPFPQTDSHTVKQSKSTLFDEYAEALRSIKAQEKPNVYKTVRTPKINRSVWLYSLGMGSARKHSQNLILPQNYQGLPNLSGLVIQSPHAESIVGLHSQAQNSLNPLHIIHKYFQEFIWLMLADPPHNWRSL